MYKIYFVGNIFSNVMYEIALAVYPNDDDETAEIFEYFMGML